MPLGRNVDDHFAKTPTPHFPRSRFDMGIHRRLQTQAHGRLYPFFCRMVYPGDTWQITANEFARMDTSFRVPLDDVYLDTYWFFVPLRILDENFPKILGEGEPSDYDDVSYGFPLTTVSDSLPAQIDFLLPYLGWSCAGATYNSTYDRFTLGSITGGDSLTSYPLAALYKIYNDWFRDENLDASYPFKDLYNADLATLNTANPTLWDNFNALRVNRFHDYFSSCVISPQKGPAVTIPLGTSAPVGFSVTSGGSAVADNMAVITSGETFNAGFNQLFLQNSSGSTSDPAHQGLIADLSAAAGTINELRLSFAVQALYERRGRYGTRYIEVLRGQWGIEVPDSFLLRPEYLGGSRTTLNNVPVLSTENSSQLGQMSGNSATLTGGSGFTKTFVEYGILMGLSCTRVKHSYTQGKRKETFMLKTQLDLYNPVFANIGYQPVYTYEMVNDPDNIGDDEVFGYQEAWADLRSDFDSFAGLFGVISNNTEIQNKWHYGDYYGYSQPYFSADWLKEPQENLSRTLTGNLIAGSTSTEKKSHQYMFAYYFHEVVTRIMPSHSVPVELIGRL